MRCNPIFILSIPSHSRVRGQITPLPESTWLDCRHLVDWSIRAACSGRITRHPEVALRPLWRVRDLPRLGAHPGQASPARSNRSENNGRLQVRSEGQLSRESSKRVQCGEPTQFFTICGFCSFAWLHSNCHCQTAGAVSSHWFEPLATGSGPCFLWNAHPLLWRAIERLPESGRN